LLTLDTLELSERVGVKPYYFTLSRLEEEGLIEYDFATEKRHLKRRGQADASQKNAYESGEELKES